MTNAHTFEIETSRLRLRPWSPADRSAVERMSTDPVMMRYITSGRIWSREEVDGFFDRQKANLETYGFCLGALVLKDNGEVVGISGLQPLDIPGEIELGWWVWKDYWGRGYATEAAREVIRFGFETAGLRRLVAVIDPPNIASIRVAEKLGLRFERTMSARETAARRDDVPISYYAIEKLGKTAR
jgi:RimJ/RimL family protein N-acetyltransferase